MADPVSPTQAVQRSFLRHAAALRGFIFGLLADHTSTDDIFQELLEVMADSAGQADDIWEDRRAALAECIQQLAPRARQILELRYADTPVAPPEIAQRLTWTVNAVHVALARARKFL